MCGFAGFLGFNLGEKNVLARMGNAIQHRGPDDDGVWLDASGIGLVHRRLSILDVSSNGHQPMHSASGRYCIAFNGEIYNHLELRRNLGHQGWIGHSDTETLLAGFEVWGILPTIKRAVGMFALLWDKKTRNLTLARDRIGEKPLYYGWHGSGVDSSFIFGSELKSLQQHPEFVDDIDRNSLALYLRHSSIPTPYSIFKNTSKLPPDTFCVFHCETGSQGLNLTGRQRRLLKLVSITCGPVLPMSLLVSSITC